MGDRSWTSFGLYACPDDLLAAVSTTLEEFGYLDREYDWKTHTYLRADPLVPADVPDLFQQDESSLGTAQACGEALMERLGDRLSEVVFVIEQAPYDGADGTLVYNTPKKGLAFFESANEIVVSQQQIETALSGVTGRNGTIVTTTALAVVDQLYGGPWIRELAPYQDLLLQRWVREREARENEAKAENARSATITPTTLQET